MTWTNFMSSPVLSNPMDRTTTAGAKRKRCNFPSLNILGLSPRETEVLTCLLMRGEDNKTIAAHLGVNIGTIRKHLENIYRKLGVNSRTEAIAYAITQLGLLER